MRENKIHIAYGFHVNCYHSYRGDTNDNLGFGSDIRIIRKILDTLTEFNENGIPVKGTWDSENFFSLEKILPEYAPDIIEKMKERVKKYGDENIIMGYSNGALGAMNEDEFTASIDLAVTNEQGSGLKDLFGDFEMLVRPQEVMFTPSQVSLYNKTGVKALCLYYSCVPFDAFRTLVPKLPDELAFNRRGIRILRLERGYQMVSSGEMADYITKALETRKPPKLSSAQLEALTIIAYYQPATKAMIDQIRGVDSSYSVAALLNKKLIEEAGRLNVPGRPIQYRTTPDFLRTFGLSSLEELPPIEKISFGEPIEAVTEEAPSAEVN